MKIDQALYGATRGGHSMLNATGDALLARDLTSRLDLPDTAPYGVGWSPFLTGFPHGQHYVLGRTISDALAARTGMVFTHALIAPLEDMASFDSLQTLVDLLCESPCPDKTIAALEVRSQSAAASEPTSEQITIAMLLVSRGRGPIVRLGHQGFDQVIIELWNRLWPSIRRGFAFRLSFGPSDLIESPLPSLVCTPQNLSARWIGYRIVGAEPTPKLLSPAAALLTGAAESSNLLDYAKRLGVEIGTFADLILLEHAYALREEPVKSLDNSIALLRLVEALSSEESNINEGKEEVVANVLGGLPNATATQVLSLRNITLTSVAQPDRIWDALRRWMADYTFPPVEDAEIVRLLMGLDDPENSVAEWRGAVVSGLNAATSNPASQFGRAFWRWGANFPDVCSHVLQCISLQDADELLLVEAAPNQIGNKAAHELLSISASRHLYRMHGVVASMVFTPLEAVRVQLDVQKEAASSGIQLALRKAQPMEVVECALAFHDSRLTQLAATAASLQPDLLAAVDMSGETAQEIWADTLRKNQESWSGPKQPEQTFQTILSRMLDGKKMETPLITALSSTPLADLKGYSRRGEVWSCLTGGTKERLMAATAAGWLSRAADGTAIPLELELQWYIVNSTSFAQTVRRFVAISLGEAVRLISLLSPLDERRFLELLPILTQSALTPSDADALGRLLLVRRWSQAAERLASLLRQGREDVRPVLRSCHSLLALWTRFRLGVAPLSREEKWQALGHVAADLYPSGPDHNDLWRRAGGSNADLQHHGDGRARWADALFKIRHGYGLRVSNLLARMREDYSWNDDLRYISHEPEFQERH